MARLVLISETSALPVDFFDAVQQEYLFRDAEKLEDETRAPSAAPKSRAAESLAFDAQVVCIAMLNADTSAGRCSLPQKIPGRLPANLAREFLPCMDEAEL